MGEETNLPVKTAVPGERNKARIGLVATDALRVLGLQEILQGALEDGDAEGAEIVALSVPGLLDDVSLSVVFIDASCTDHLIELLTTFRKLRPRVRLIVIGETTDPDYVRRVIGAGAKGYLTQTAPESEIRLALNIVQDGSIWAPRKILARLLDASTGFEMQGMQPEAKFTKREAEVLRLLTAGMNNRAIAQELGINESTVKAHISRLMRKVGATNRVELTLRGIARGFGELD